MVLQVLLNCAKIWYCCWGILVSVVNMFGLLLSRLSLCKLLYIFLFLLFSLSVTVYCANFRLIVVSDFALAEYSVNGPLDVQANGSRQHVSNHMDLC